MLEAGAICPSQSPWCNAVVLVWKKDSTLHFCVNFRHLNAWMKKDLYPLPHLQEALESMVGLAHFSSMDFKLCNAPAMFQHLMQNTLGELNLMYCVIYLDYVIVFGCMEEEHLEHLRIVFKRFWEFNLKLKPSKCSFFQSEIVYLAHHVSQRSIPPSQENV